MPSRSDFESFESVEGRLMEAFETLAALPDRERRFLRHAQSALWRDVVPDRVDIDVEPAPARPGVSRHQMMRMDEALGWCELLDGEARRVMGAAMIYMRGGARAVHWPEIKRRLRSDRTTDALRKVYSRGLSKICFRLNTGR